MEGLLVPVIVVIVVYVPIGNLVRVVGLAVVVVIGGAVVVVEGAGVVVFLTQESFLHPTKKLTQTMLMTVERIISVKNNLGKVSL